MSFEFRTPKTLPAPSLATRGAGTGSSDITDLDARLDVVETKLATIAVGADDVNATTVGAAIHGATAKTTIVDADEHALIDSAASNALKRITWANTKTAIWTALGPLIDAGTAKATPVDADDLVLSDSAATNASKKLSWANLKTTLKTYFDTVYPTLIDVVDMGGGFPFRRFDYGPELQFSNKVNIGFASATLDATGNRFTVGGTAGALSFAGYPYQRLIANEFYAIWFETISGSLTTANVRFIGAGGAALGSDIPMLRLGNFYVLLIQSPATTTSLNVIITNNTGSSCVMTRPAYALRKTTPKDYHPDPMSTAAFSLFAQNDADAAGNLWATTSVAKVSGAGAVPTLNPDGSVVCPADAVHYARSDLGVGDGDVHTWLVKFDTGNPNIKYVYIRYVGSLGTELAYLGYMGNGWWGLVGWTVGSVTPVGTTFYVRVEIDNSLATPYTAATATVEHITLLEAATLPNELPGVGAHDIVAYDKSEIVVLQSSGGIDVYIPGSNPATSKYVRWQLRSYTGALGGGTGWEIERLHECARTADTAFTTGNQLTDIGAHWLAVREVGKTHVGGDTHGFQIASASRLFVDFAKKAIDGTTPYRGRWAEFIMTSQLLNLTDSTPLFDVTSHVQFSADGVIFRHRLVTLQACTIASMYLAMLSMSRWINNTSASGEMFDNVYWSPLYGEQTMTGGDVESTAYRYIISGDSGITVDAEVIDGWLTHRLGSGALADNTTRESFVQRATNSIKLYFSPTGIDQGATTGRALTVGEIWEMATRLRVVTSN